jgi:hypothetical protein
VITGFYRSPGIADAIKQPVGSVRVILGDMPPDIIKVGFGLWPFQNLGHED